MAKLIGEKPPRVTVLNKFMVYLLSPFMPFMRETIEMLPNFVFDYVVDDTDFVRAFGIEATPYEQALKETVNFFRELRHQQQKSSSTEKSVKMVSEAEAHKALA